jgi:hypothetical protein
MPNPWRKEEEDDDDWFLVPEYCICGICRFTVLKLWIKNYNF